MNAYFGGGDETSMCKELVQLELLVTSLEGEMRGKISMVINVYDDPQWSRSAFEAALQKELLKIGSS